MSVVTIKDGAKEVNVSFSTVSRVIRNAQNVRSETRKKVLRTNKKLNYHVDAGARGMVKRQTKSIGLCISDISNPFYPPLTAVSQPTYTIGTTAAQLLLQRLLGEGPVKKQTIVLQTELIIRRSCGFTLERCQNSKLSVA